MSFLSRERLPDGWVGPSPGSFRELYGVLPPAAQSTAAEMRAAAAHLIAGLERRLDAVLSGYIDSLPEHLPRRVRLLGTDVTPAVFALLALEAEDPLGVWALSKFEALVRLEARYRGEEGPQLARRFYEDCAHLYGERFDAGQARQTFKTGVRFLRWAQAKGRELSGGS